MGQSGHIGDHNNLVNTILAMGAGLNCLDSAYAGGADPTGGSDSAPAINATLNACLPGQAAFLPAGTYATLSPVVIPPYAGLVGSPATSSISQNGGGSMLVPGSGFTSGTWPVAAVVLVVDQATGGYATMSEEQHVSDIMIQGTSLSGSSNVTGLALYSGNSDQISRVSLQNILVNGMTGWGFSDAGPQAEVHVRAFNVGIRGCGANHSLNAGGFNVHSSDSEYLFCGSYSNFGDAWFVTNSWDSAFGQCHGEHSQAGYGFHFLGTYNNSQVDAGSICFANCTIDAGELHGWFIESTGTALPPVTITGGYVRRSGTSGTYAGVCVNAYFGPVDITNMQVYPGQPDGGGSNFPSYALQVTGCGPKTNVTVSGGTWIGTSAFLNCDGSQGLLTVSGDTTFGSGISTAATIYTPGVALQAAQSPELVPVDRLLGMQQAGALATSHDRGFVTGSFSPNSGIPYWHLVNLYAGVPISNLNTWVTGTAKSGGSHGWAAIASVTTGTTGTIVAVSADQTDSGTTWGTANAAGTPIPVAYTPPVTGPYWLGQSVTASTMPTLGANTNNPVANLVTTLPVYCGSSPSQSAPPSVGSTFIISGVAADDFYIWAD